MIDGKLHEPNTVRLSRYWNCMSSYK